MSTNEAAGRLLNELQENPLPGARHAYSIVRDRLPAILAHERSAGARHTCDFNSGPGSDQCGECGKFYSAGAAPIDVVELARVMYDADPNYCGLGMGSKVEWDELTDATRGEFVVEAADIAIRYERDIGRQSNDDQQGSGAAATADRGLDDNRRCPRSCQCESERRAGLRAQRRSRPAR